MFRIHDRIENDKNAGLDLLWAGPNATNVPKEAILVESLSQDIQLSNASQWSNTKNLQFYGPNAWQTNLHGASLTYTFEGVAIWFYGNFYSNQMFYNISLDGANPERVTSALPSFLTQ